MKVEIWSDVICPFCYIGKRRFEAALERFSHKDEIEVIYRSFELDPHSKREIDYSIHQMLANKYGMTLEQAKAKNKDLAGQARTIGLTFNFDSMILTNTFDAHRLSHFASQRGKMTEMTERLLQAYFTESKHIGDHNVLAELAEEVGLDRKEAITMLESDEFTHEVRADEEEAGRLGVQGVPFFVINRKYAISGAQSSEVFLEALQKAWSEFTPPLTVLNSLNDNTAKTDNAVCTDDVCIPADQK